MPYISQLERAALLEDGAFPISAGQLNYGITSFIDMYLGEGISYSKLNEVIGVLECVKLELYRRIAAPYEDKKIIENGDVYGERA